MKQKVIVIDDSRSLLQYTVHLLENAGFASFGAPDGLTGLELIEKHDPDVILLDIVMPGMIGLDVLRILREKKVMVSILLFSTLSTLAERVEGLKTGADDYIVKPFEDEELIARVGCAARRIALEKNLAKLVDIRTRDFIRKERQAVFGQMVQGIVHNLNNPLMAVSGFAEILKMKLGNFSTHSQNRIDEDGTALLKEIMHDLEKLSSATDMTKSLVITLLEKSRYESSEKKQRINLNRLITREIEFLKADRELKHAIKITLALDPSIPEVFCVYTDFSQIVANMIKNAADAMRDSSQKELIISTSHENENLYIHFKDTGEGISHVNLERIFEPFFTTKTGKDSKKSKRRGGAGLGLHTCTELMKLYDARILVKSSVGVGTVFTISIPGKNICRQLN